MKLPLVLSSVRAGFPTPGEGDIEKSVDLNELLISHPAATFFVRVEGNSMEGAGIEDGDLLIVDRAVQPTVGKIVIAVLNGEMTVKRLGKKELRSENPQFPSFALTPDTQIWGVVTYIIKKR